MQSRNYFYQVINNNVNPVPLITNPDGHGGSIISSLLICNSLEDFGAGSLPEDCIHKLAIYQPPCHTICIFVWQIQVPFENLDKRYIIFLGSIPTVARPEVHFYLFHKRKAFFLRIWRQEKCQGVQDHPTLALYCPFSQRDKIYCSHYAGASPGTKPALLTWTTQKMRWTRSIFCTKSVLASCLLPMGQLQPRAELGSILHPIIWADGDFPGRSHKLAYRVIEMDVDNVTNGDDFIWPELDN